MEETENLSAYMDLHNWRFTPSSFRLILADLFAMKKLHLKENTAFFSASGCEFLMSLYIDKLANPTQSVDRLSLLKQSMLEIKDSIDTLLL
jgi:hypothetical protein